MIKAEREIERPYDIHDLLALTAREFLDLDSRVTSANGRPGKGVGVVITNKVTGEDISEPLADWEVEALYVRITTAFPDTACTLHRPYQRGRRLRFDGGATCTCTKVFASRLLDSRVTALANALDAVQGEYHAAVDAWLASEERWPGVLQDSLFAGEQAP